MNFRIFFLSLCIFLVGIGVMFWISSYDYYKAIHTDDPIQPTFVVNTGNATIIRWETAFDLTEKEELPLETGDAIETRTKSQGMITWPDHSVTRLGENTRVVVSQMEVSQNYDSIKISMDLKRWKTWNNVVRTMLGDSYFETKLPKNNIVAAVRGTVYEINLDGGYIHAVTHSMRLSDISGKSLSLLPWELVSSENIWIRKGKELLDTTWERINTRIDTLYLESRSQLITKQKNLLSGKENSQNIWDQFVRKILSLFPSFDALNISHLIETGNINELLKSNTETLVTYYQKYQWIDFAKERDHIRDALSQKIANWTDQQKVISSLKNSAFWDMMENKNISLPGAEKILKDQINQAGSSIENIRNILNQKNLNEDVKIQLKKWLSF